MHAHLYRTRSGDMKYRLLAILVMAAIVSVFSVSAKAQDEAVAFNFALAGNPDTLDPQKTSGTLTFQTVRSIYDTLVEPDENGKLVPALAESWSVSQDSLTWTFALRKGVTFHNGDPFTSADVRATLERVVDEATASPSASEFAVISGISTPDDYTVVLQLSEPSAPLLSSLASGWGAILPSKLIKSGHDFGRSPVGTGPFRFVEWVPDSKIVMEKNPDYWMSGRPSIDNLTFNIIVEPSVQVQALMRGELDAIFNVSEEDLDRLRSDPNITVERRLTALVMVMAMNTRKPPLDNLQVRQAINYAIDKQKVLDIAYGGGKPIGTFMDYGDPYYEDFTSLYPYDPEKAKALLAAAGVGEDTVLELFLPQVYEPHVRAGELYQEMLNNVGLNVEIRLVDWSTWISDVYRGGKFDLTVIGHTGKLDPDGRLAGYGTANTYVGWVNDEAHQLIVQARKTVDFAERKKYYSRVLEIMAREVPFVFTGTSYRYIALRSNVSGFRMDSKLDTFDFRYVSK